MAGTPTTERAVRTAKAPGRRRAPLALAAIVTTTWAALVSYVPVVAAVALFAGRPQLSIGTGGWLLAHGVPLSTSAGRFGLIPLGLSVLAAWRVGRAGVHTSRAIGARTPGRVALAVGAVAVIYGGLGALAAVVTRGLVAPARAGLTLAGFAVVCAGLGALSESRLLRRAARRLPPVLRDGLRTGTVAALLVLGAGAGVAGVALAVSGGQAAATLAAYLVGPGFAFGTGTTVSAASVKLGALPAVPVLAGLPDSAVSGLGPLLLGLPMAGGMAAGWLLVRRRLRRAREQDAPVPGWGPLVSAAVLAGPVAGALLGLASWASGGPLGSGRLAVTGPAGWPVAWVGALVIALGALLAAAGTRVLAGRRQL